MKSLSESRHRSQAHVPAAGLDEQALRLEAVLMGKDLSPFVDYKNTTAHDQILTLFSLSDSGQGEVLVAEADGNLSVLPTQDEAVLVEPGESIRLACQRPHGSPFVNAAFSVTSDQSAFHYVAFWFQPLASDKARCVELPALSRSALNTALQNWTRRQLATKAQAKEAPRATK